jgi:hypothetical protein
MCAVRQIRTSIDIVVSPTRLWSVLTDFPAYPTWNPFTTSIEGKLQPGAQLRVTIAPPGRRPMTFRPVVLTALRVNTGEVVVRTIETGGHTEYTPVGHVTNLAARMQTAAPAGSIAASEATQRLCEGYFEFRALGPTAIKGLNAPVEVYEVVRAGPLRMHFELAARRGLPGSSAASANLPS